jgi:hypothetical protein
MVERLKGFTNWRVFGFAILFLAMFAFSTWHISSKIEQAKEEIVWAIKNRE